MIGTDKNDDIALLKIKTDTELPFITFANSDNVKVGEWVLAVGNPYNLTSTVTAGIVSAKGRDLDGNGSIDSFIQTDAAVNPGNSGGALVNTRGELIGINTAISSRTGSFIGYSFAVPSNITKKVIDDLLEFGNVQEAVLGIRFSPQENNDVLGVKIADVEAGQGAANSGLKKDDIITKIDGEEVELEEVELEDVETLIKEVVEIIDSEEEDKGNQPRVVDLSAEDANQGNEENAFTLKASEEDDAPAQTVMTAGATADPVKDYLKQIGRVALLNAELEVELATRMEAGLFAEEKLATEKKIEAVIVCGDSDLVISQMDGRKECKAENLQKLNLEAKKWAGQFQSCVMYHVVRMYNGSADLLTKMVVFRIWHSLLPHIVGEESRSSREIIAAQSREKGAEYPERHRQIDES